MRRGSVRSVASRAALKGRKPRHLPPQGRTPGTLCRGNEPDAEGHSLCDPLLRGPDGVRPTETESVAVPGLGEGTG